MAQRKATSGKDRTNDGPGGGVHEQIVRGRRKGANGVERCDEGVEIPIAKFPNGLIRICTQLVRDTCLFVFAFFVLRVFAL